jgi:hypothetical protein
VVVAIVDGAADRLDDVLLDPLGFRSRSVLVPLDDLERVSRAVNPAKTVKVIAMKAFLRVREPKAEPGCIMDMRMK